MFLEAQLNKTSPDSQTDRSRKKLSALTLAEQLGDMKLKYLPSTMKLSIMPIFLTVVNNLGFSMLPPDPFHLSNFSSYPHINHWKWMFQHLRPKILMFTNTVEVGKHERTYWWANKTPKLKIFKFHFQSPKPVWTAAAKIFKLLDQWS